LIPASLASGAKVGPFDVTSADGKEVATITVAIQETNVSVATGDGVAHPTLQIKVDTVLKCAPGQACQLTGSVNSTRWLGYDGLELKDHSVSNIAFGAYHFTSDTTSLLDKASPS
jgi:hypothetical protein